MTEIDINQAAADFQNKIMGEMERNGFLPGFMAGSCLLLARQGDYTSAAYGYRMVMRDNSQIGAQTFERLKRMFTEEETKKIMEGVELLDSHSLTDPRDNFV